MIVEYFYPKFFQNVLTFLYTIKNSEKRSILKRLNKITFTDAFLNSNTKFGKQ